MLGGMSKNRKTTSATNLLCFPISNRPPPPPSTVPVSMVGKVVSKVVGRSAA